MKYIDIQKNLEKLKVFSSQDLKILDDKYDKSKIFKWKKKWYIQQIIRWYYIFSDIDLNEAILYLISNKIYPPSYISLETAFSYYWLIPEQVFTITWVSTRKTNEFKTAFGVFNYKKIKPKLFFWYNIVSMKGNKILLASLEKAILDYFYLYKNVSSTVDLEYLRWNKEVLKEKLDIKLLKKYSSLLGNNSVNKKIDLLDKYINND